MSQPRLTETINGVTSLTVDVDNNILRVTNDPGFVSENGDGCPYRSVVLQGPVSYGVAPAKTTAPDHQFEGRFESRDDLAAWRKPLTSGRYKLTVYAGTLFEPWVPGQPGPFIEWGSDDLGQNPSGLPIVNQVEFVVPAIVEPPAGSFAELRAHAVTDLDQAQKLVPKPRASAPAVYYAHCLLTAGPEQRHQAFAALSRVFPA